MSYEKAEREIPGSVSRTAILTYLSETILLNYKFQVSERTLRNLYQESLQTNTDIRISSDLLQKLCLYLGYDSYQEFLSAHFPTSQPSFWVRNKKTWGLALVVAGLLLTVNFISFLSDDASPCAKQKMALQWQDSLYILVPVDLNKIKTGAQKPCDENLLTGFRKVNPDASYPFFSSTKNPLLFYEKGRDGTYEFFTMLDYHPETHRPLKPITPYIIEKYIINKKQ